MRKAEKEIEHLRDSMKASSFGPTDTEVVREKLETIRNRNLYETTFEEKFEIASKLGIKVYPSKDLRSMRVPCELNLPQLESCHRYESGPFWARTRDLSLIRTAL